MDRLRQKNQRLKLPRIVPIQILSHVPKEPAWNLSHLVQESRSEVQAHLPKGDNP